MRCAFHTETTAITLCADCARTLCHRCTTSVVGGHVCAAGCEATPRSVNAASQAALPLVVPAGTSRSESTPFTQWLRAGAATFLVGSTAFWTHWAALALVGCLASFFCLTNAWRSHQAARWWLAQA